jgi:hypothetical protein
MKPSVLVDYAINAWMQGWGYVLTGQGELYTPELAEAWIKSPDHYPHAGWIWGQREYFIGEKGCKRWFNHFVADCSGLIVAAFRSHIPGYEDQTADTFKARFTESGTIKTLPDVPGLALWRPGHIGIYIGGEQAIEARGYAYGVVRTAVKDRTWTRWGKLKDVEYDGGDIMLQRGNHGDSVNAWQKALMADDISLPRFGADSDFGGETETGTKAFQKKHGLKQTGKVDEDTMAMMFVVLISKNADPGKSKKLQGIIDNLHGRLDEIREITDYPLTS